jgi:hypothetical protein
MAHTMQPPSDSRKAKPVQLDRARQLASTLLSERGEASGAQLAREQLQVLRALDAATGTASSAILRPSFTPTKRHCAPQRSAISPTAQRKPRQRWRRRPIRPGKSCCGA